MSFVGEDIDDRLDVQEPSFRANRPDGLYGFDCSSYQLRLELESSASDKRIHRSLIAGGPGEERDFVHRHEHGRHLRLLLEPADEGRSISRQAENKFGFEQIDVLRPAKMAQIPNDLSAGVACRFKDRKRGGKIIFSRR